MLLKGPQEENQEPSIGLGIRGPSRDLSSTRGDDSFTDSKQKKGSGTRKIR